MNNKIKIVLAIVVLLIIVAILGTVIGISSFISEKVCQFQGGVYATDCSAHGPEYKSCYKEKETQTVDAICQGLEQKNNEVKLKVEASVKYLNSAITPEQKLVLEVWQGLFATSDSQYYNEHIIPVWIEEKERVLNGQKYKTFHISYSVKMGDWYLHEVGNFNGSTNYNWVMIRADQYSQFIESLKNTMRPDTLLRPVVGSRDYLRGKFSNLKVMDMYNAAHLLAEFNDFDGVVAAQKYPFLANNLTCQKIIQSMQGCDAKIDFFRFNFGLNINDYGIKQVNNRITKQDRSMTDNAWLSANTSYKTGKLDDCHQTKIDLATGKVSCEAISCEPNLNFPCVIN